MAPPWLETKTVLFSVPGVSSFPLGGVQPARLVALVALKLTLVGKVHNVGYGLFLLEAADQMFIPRFDARNVMINGKEGLIVLVDGEKEQLERFVRFAKTEKPEEATLEEVKVEDYDEEVRNIERVRASFNTTQLSKIVQIGLRMIGRQDVTIEKQDNMLGKMDLMLEKQGETLTEIKGLRGC